MEKVEEEEEVAKEVVDLVMNREVAVMMVENSVEETINQDLQEEEGSRTRQKESRREEDEI